MLEDAHDVVDEPPILEVERPRTDPIPEGAAPEDGEGGDPE